MDTTFIVSWDMILSQKQSRQSHEEVQLQSTIQKKVYSLHHEPIFTIGVILRMDLWDLNISKLLLSLICSLSSFVLLCFWNDTGFFFIQSYITMKIFTFFFFFFSFCYVIGKGLYFTIAAYKFSNIWYSNMIKTKRNFDWLILNNILVLCYIIV